MTTAQIASQFEAVIQLLDADKKNNLIGALIDLIKRDESLKSNHRKTFEQCLGGTVDAIISIREVNLQMFLAGLFLYTVLTNQNTTNEAKTALGIIKGENYIEQFNDFEVRIIEADTPSEQFIIPFDLSVRKYLSALKNKYSTIKTLLYYEEPHPFYDFYVCNAVTFVKRKAISDSEDYINGIIEIQHPTPFKIEKHNQYAILAAYGGMGKSMMMRHFLLTAIEQFDAYKRIPLFIQLKDYHGGASQQDLLRHIYSCTFGLQSEIQINQFETMLEEGQFLVLLDGLDELGSAYQEDFVTALDRFIDSYPDNQFVMSSRPFSDFISFGRFAIYHVSPFTNDQALELINKLEFRPDDPTIKAKFVRALNDTLFETHHDFVSNPLLLTIMLMTFGQLAEISPRMHIFYRDAYAVLSQRHDASKGAFKRQLKTGLTSEQFADIFAEFCARTYTNEKYEMTEEEATRYFSELKECNKYPNRSISAASFLYDLCANMCLMYKESGKYHFTHRSFQEYLCALFFSKQKDKSLKRIGDFFENSRIRFFAMQTFEMLYDMIPEKVEEYIFMPYLDRLFEACEKGAGYWTYVENMYPRLFCDAEDAITSIYPEEPLSFIIGFISQCLNVDWGSPFTGMIPRYEQFLCNRLVILEHSSKDLVDIDAVEQDYIDKYGIPDVAIYRYAYETKTILKDPETYREMVEILMSADFPPTREYQALIDYRSELHKRFDNVPEDIFDFL